MRLFYPGQFALPATLVVAAILTILGGFGIVAAQTLRALVPFGLIAAGSEELYFWAKSKRAPAKEDR